MGIQLGQLDHAPLVLNPQPPVEHVARHLDPTAGAAARRFPQPTVGLDDVIVGDLVHGAHHEAAIQIGLVGGEAQLPSLLPALARGSVLAERLVRGVVVAVQEVAQAQRECLASGVHVGGAVEGTQHLIVSGAVEALDGAVALGIPGGAVDQQGAQAALDHGQGVVGDEARAFVQVVQIRKCRGA